MKKELVIIVETVWFDPDHQAIIRYPYQVITTFRVHGIFGTVRDFDSVFGERCVGFASCNT